MTIARCPECRDEVRLPAALVDETVIRCPLCGEQFPAAKILHALPPMVEVISGAGMPSIDAGGESVTAGVRIEVDTGDEERENPPAFLFEEADAPQREAPDYVASESSAGTSTPVRSRPRRRQRSIVPTLIAVVLGGFASIPLAQLFIWWIADDDPLQTGPSVSKYVRFVVPQKFQAPEISQADDRQATDSSDERAKDRRSDRDDNRGKILLRRDDPAPYNRDGDSSPGNRNSSEDDSTDESNDVAPNPVDGSGQVASTTDDAGGGSGSPGQLVDSSGLSNPTNGIRLIRRTGAEEVSEELNRVLATHDTWANIDKVPEEDRGTVYDEFFSNFRGLGEAVMFIDPTDVSSLEACRQLELALRPKLDDSRLRKFISNRTVREIGESLTEESQGVAFTGQLAETIREGRFIRNRIVVDDINHTELDVYGWLNPPEIFQPGCRVAILGARIADPQNRIGLEADADDVICGGYVIILEPATTSDDADG